MYLFTIPLSLFKRLRNMLASTIIFFKDTSCLYRQISLSQSSRDHTKCFEISVVWDSQSVTSFPFFMFMELQFARKQSRPVELQNVTDSALFIHSKNICDQCLLCTPFPQVYLWYKLINLTQFLQHVGNMLFTSKNTVKQCSVIKLQRRHYVLIVHT